ncbi:Hypothetical_protein [Hexamita inflata]|uniref:Hypothetical_protein n=1 Tax=Hexamita inflata TaxID=28002 RepID=A0ABP1H750_9EUKA
MAQGVSDVMNPFIQVLPIFELDLSQVETSDSNSTIRNEYDTYLNLGKNLIECKFSEIEPVLKTQIPPSIISLNPLLLPFQYTILKSRNEPCPIQYWVSLMVEQSHMFKVFNCVLNYIYHKAITSSITNSFSIMHEGSKTGKSTFILAILYAYLFHSQLNATPIVANNCPGSALQQLYYQNNLLLQDQIGSLNKKFIDFINNYQKYDLNNEMLISYIINANLQDWSGYTHVVIKVAENIQKQLCSNTLLKYIISKKIDQTPFKTIEQFLITQFHPKNTEETLEQFISNVQKIFYNETLCTLINTVSQLVAINRKGVNQDIDDMTLKQLLNIDSHTIKQLFKQINYYLVNQQTIKPISGILLIDEICYTKIDVSQQNKADYQTLLLQLTKYLIINYKSKDFILLFKQSLQSVFKQTNNQYLLQFEQIINPLDKITSADILRTLFLIFPLSMFLRENGVMNIILEDRFKQMCMQQNWYQNDNQQIIKEQFTQFIELSNISGFEVLAYRDILNAVVQINNDNKDGSYNIWKNNIQDYNLTTFMLKIAFQEKQNKLVYQEEMLKDKLKKCQDLQLVQDQYSIVCAGTNAKFPDFINYCSNLLQTGGSRLQQNRNMFLYFVSLLVPQLHPSITNKLYYIHGINSVKYSQIKPEYSLQYLVSDLFTISQSDSTSFAQTICSAISPQLVIVQTDNKVFYPIKQQVTYYKLALQEYRIHKICVDNYNNQLALCIDNGFNNDVYEQRVVVSFKNNLIRIPLQQIYQRIQTQALSTNNQPILADTVNALLKLFFNKMQTSIHNQKIVQILMDNMLFKTKFSQIVESLSLLHLLSVLKGDQVITTNIELIMQETFAFNQFQQNYEKLQNITAFEDTSYSQMINAIQKLDIESDVNLICRLSKIINDNDLNCTFLKSKPGLQNVDKLEKQIESTLQKISQKHQNISLYNLSQKTAIFSIIDSYFDIIIDFKLNRNDYLSQMNVMLQIGDEMNSFNFDIKAQDHQKNIQVYKDQLGQLSQNIKDIKKYSKQESTTVQNTNKFKTVLQNFEKASQTISSLKTTILQYKAIDQTEVSSMLQKSSKSIYNLYNTLFVSKQTDNTTLQHPETNVKNYQEICQSHNESRNKFIKPGFAIKLLNVEKTKLMEEQQIINVTQKEIYDRDQQLYISMLQPELPNYNLNARSKQSDQKSQFIRKQLDIMSLTAKYKISQGITTVILAIGIDHQQLFQNDVAQSFVQGKQADFLIGISDIESTNCTQLTCIYLFKNH